MVAGSRHALSAGYSSVTSSRFRDGQEDRGDLKHLQFLVDFDESAIIAVDVIRRCAMCEGAFIQEDIAIGNCSAKSLAM